MTLKSAMSTLYASALLCGAGVAHSQTTQYQPPTDSSAQASPLTSPPRVPASDSSAQASPIAAPQAKAGTSLPPRTAIRVVLAQSLNSGSLKNGQSVQARLASDLPARGKNAGLRQGTMVKLDVVETVPAGKLNAVGELSLQVERIGDLGVVTDILTFRGQPGHRDLPDSAPEKGTDATLASGSELIFHVQPDPVAAKTAPTTAGQTPGSVDSTPGSGKPD